MKALLDADTFIWQAASRFNGSPIFWGEGETTDAEPDESAAREHLQSHVERVLKLVGARSFVMCLSSYDKPWRKQVLPTYKANRKELPKPKLLGPLRSFVKSEYTWEEYPGCEGDDVMGILQTENSIIVSMDKDMKTVPGKHFNPGKYSNLKDARSFDVSLEEADRWHMFQTLTGDVTDGYAGCVGIGKAKAERYLKMARSLSEMWLVVEELYNHSGQGLEVALQTARVARICRSTDYDLEKREVKLWVPPT